MGIEKDSYRLKQQVNSLGKISRELNEYISFNLEEQELIRRVLKAVYGQMKSGNDKRITKGIFRKTDWVE